MGQKHPRWGVHCWFIINATSIPLDSIPVPIPEIALYCQNKTSPEWQFWQDSLPKIILLDSTGMTRFWQESQGHDKDLIKGRGMFLYLAATSLKKGHSNFFLVLTAIISKGVIPLLKGIMQGSFSLKSGCWWLHYVSGQGWPWPLNYTNI